MGSFNMNNKTTFIRIKKNDNFTILSNSIIKSTDYTPQEKDILFYLLHLPNDWVIYKENVKKHYKKTIGSTKFDDTWRELKTKGHIQGIRIKLQNGKFSSWEYKIIEQPSTDIPNSDISENGVVENTSTQNHRDILSTNLESTNEQNTNSTNLYNTSKILEDENIQLKSQNVKKNWTEKEIQRDINQSAFKSIFNKTSVNWENELIELEPEEFIQKYVSLDNSTGDDYRIRNLVENYFKLRDN
jgi:hypothetical protein